MSADSAVLPLMSTPLLVGHHGTVGDAGGMGHGGGMGRSRHVSYESVGRLWEIADWKLAALGGVASKMGCCGVAV